MARPVFHHRVIQSRNKFLVASNESSISEIPNRTKSENPSIFTVEAQGLIRGSSVNGDGSLLVTHEGLSQTLTVRNLGNGTYLYFQKPSDWERVAFYSWVEDQGREQEFVPWPGVEVSPAVDLGGRWYRMFVGDEVLTGSGTLKFIFNNYGQGQQSPDISYQSDVSPYYDAQGLVEEVPQPDTSLDGTQLQIHGGEFILGNRDEGLSGKLFVPGQLLGVRAEEAGPGRRFLRWEGTGSPYLLDAASADTQLVVGLGQSLTFFAIFESSDDPYQDTRETYRRYCSGCHGTDGHGRPPLRNLNERYSRSELIDFIDTNMPKFQSELCQGECARDMANFLIAEAFQEGQGSCDPDSFGSMRPQERSLRLLTRLEYENTIEDLLGIDGKKSIRDMIPEDFVVNHFQTDRSAVYTRQHAYGYFRLASILAKEAKDFAEYFPSCDGSIDCFIDSFGLRAFRRPLNQDERIKYQNLYKILGYERLLQAFLSSPHLLYRSELGDKVEGLTEEIYRLNDYEVASLLSYSFWKSMPDDIALGKAAKGVLQSRDQIAEEARRLLESPKARQAFRSFWDGLYGLKQVISADIPQSMKSYLKEETLRFVEHVVFDRQGKFEDLLLSNETFLNAALADYYGVSIEGQGWQRYDWQEIGRKGILGKAHFFAINSTTVASHPVKRGLFVREMLLCQDFPPPPIGAELKPVKDPNQTTREKFERSHRQDSCLSCHQFIDGIGFGLESYDQFGRLRDLERVPSGLLKPIDARGEIGSLNSAETILSAEEPVESFTGISELSYLLNSSKNSRACFARQLYRFHVGDRVSPEQSCTLRVFAKDFKAEQGSILDLMVSYTQTLNFIYRK